MAFYNRFKNNNVEAFSNDVVFTAFSNKDPEYISAGDSCTYDKNYTCDSIPTKDSPKLRDCLCDYKKKVDELAMLKSTHDFSKKNLDDSNEIYSSVTMDSINLGIGILIMVATISYMNN
jgi:hypothetical protein